MGFKCLIGLFIDKSKLLLRLGDVIYCNMKQGEKEGERGRERENKREMVNPTEHLGAGEGKRNGDGK